MDQPRATLSVVVLTKNEEDKIARCLEHVKWADQLVVVDGLSTDRTVEICRAFGATVVSHAFDGSFATDRNLGIEHATGEWVLQIDADDIVTPEFRVAVQRLLASRPAHAAVKFRRKSYFLGRFMRYGGWHHYLPNLIRRDAVRYVGDVHERPVVNGSMGVLDADIEHHPCEDLTSFLSRQNRYTSLQADEWLRQAPPKAAAIIRRSLVRRPLKTFWKSYVKKQGFREGLYGFVFAVFFAGVELIKWAKCWQRFQAGRWGDGSDGTIVQLIERQNHDTAGEAIRLQERYGRLPLWKIWVQIGRQPITHFWQGYVQPQIRWKETGDLVFPLLSTFMHTMAWAKYWQLLVQGDPVSPGHTQPRGRP